MFNPIHTFKDIVNDSKVLPYYDAGAIILTLIIITPLLWLIECFAWLEYKVSSKLQKRHTGAEKEVKRNVRNK